MTCDLSIQEPEYLNFESFKEGIKELEKNKIVAKGTKKIVISLIQIFLVFLNVMKILSFDEEEEMKTHFIEEYPNKRLL